MRGSLPSSCVRSRALPHRSARGAVLPWEGTAGSLGFPVSVGRNGCARRAVVVVIAGRLPCFES